MFEQRETTSTHVERQRLEPLRKDVDDPTIAPGDYIFCRGVYALVTAVVIHQPGDHSHSPIRNEYVAREVKTDMGDSRWRGWKVPTVSLSKRSRDYPTGSDNGMSFICNRWVFTGPQGYRVVCREDGWYVESYAGSSVRPGYRTAPYTEDAAHESAARLARKELNR